MLEKKKKKEKKKINDFRMGKFIIAYALKLFL